MRRKPDGDFEARVDRNGPTPEHAQHLGGCWLWVGRKDRRGYGSLHRRDWGENLAHRLSYCRSVGPIPDGLCVLHRCDNPPCVRPDHLFLGTQRDNVKDMDAKRRRNPPRNFGERNGSAKLTRHDVARIRYMRLGGTTIREISAAFGVSPATVFRAATGQAWAA